MTKIDIKMSEYPRTKAAQAKFKCKVGDIVWFVGGYTIGADYRSFGRRARVVQIKATGSTGGIFVVPDNDPHMVHKVSWVITRSDVLESLKLRKTDEARSEFLALFQLQPGDLVESAESAATEKKTDALSKSELIRRVKELEAEVAALRAATHMPKS